MNVRLDQDEITYFRNIFDQAFIKNGSEPGDDDWATCYSILEIRRTSLALAEQCRSEGNRLKFRKLEERAVECKQVFSDLATHLAEEKLVQSPLLVE